VALLLALGLGVLGAILANQVPRIAVALAGFFGGALAAASLAGWLGLQATVLLWLVALVGGILGTILLSAVFDWGLIGLSSLAGAAMVVDGLDLSRAVGGVVLLGLFLLGVILQGVWMRSKKD
jgi:hypothetical protein